jgi:serine acetyltransferase
MTAPGIVLVDDIAEGPAHLCGRLAVDWLLDTIEALSPVVVEADSGPVRDRIALRPALRSGVPGSTTLVLPCSVPLLRPATLRRIVESLPAGAPTAVLVELAGPAPWWADEPRSAGPAVVAVTGVDFTVVAGDAASIARRLATAGSLVQTSRLDGVEALCLNDPADRVAAENALYERIVAGWLARGVVVEDPATTRIDFGVRIGAGSRIRPHTELIGETVIGRGSRIGPTTTVRDSRVGDDCLVHYSVCQNVEIGNGANIGPFAWLRSGTTLGDRCRAGAFVELSDSVIGDGTEIPHLAGLFSADVGRNCNVASMSGSLNYNGGQKRRTHIGDDVSIGSGSILIAPVSIGDGAETAAGSVITEDVPDGALGIARTPQRNVTGWASTRRPV